MAERVCGASEERDALSAARCWCGALFCGPGGWIQTKNFRRALHTKAIARTRAEFFELVQQADLFVGDEIRQFWIARVDRRKIHAGRDETAPAENRTRSGRG
jgi:glycine/D-amino acid oxidase-like deaminating enzyme